MRSMFFIAASSLIASTLSAYSQPDKVLYELQQRCGKLAKQFAAEWKTRTIQRTGPPRSKKAMRKLPSMSRLNKCFYLEIITIPMRVPMRHLTLFDLNDNKEFGTYSEGMTVHCEVRGQNCKSEAEWRATAKLYCRGKRRGPPTHPPPVRPLARDRVSIFRKSGHRFSVENATIQKKPERIPVQSSRDALSCREPEVRGRRRRRDGGHGRTTRHDGRMTALPVVCVSNSW